MALKLEKLIILVVEDTTPVSKLISKILETLGVGRIFTASDGSEGFDLFCKANPDIVITDWHMPSGNGLELLKKIRTSDFSPNKLAPVIMITGYNAPERISKCRDQGITEYLAKPFTAQDLIKRITYVIKAPRDFIDCTNYFGPDRRRKQSSDFKGELKRENDSQAKSYA